jgi:hypothetical protein
MFSISMSLRIFGDMPLISGSVRDSGPGDSPPVLSNTINCPLDFFETAGQIPLLLNDNTREIGCYWTFHGIQSPFSQDSTDAFCLIL